MLLHSSMWLTQPWLKSWGNSSDQVLRSSCCVSFIILWLLLLKCSNIFNYIWSFIIHFIHTILKQKIKLIFWYLNISFEPILYTGHLFHLKCFYNIISLLFNVTWIKIDLSILYRKYVVVRLTLSFICNIYYIFCITDKEIFQLLTFKKF